MPKALWHSRARNLFRGGAADVGVIALLVAATIGWSLFAGKDLNFDQLNYHFYIAHSLFHDRLSHDFMAANGQSYLNPLAYVPFYWMVTHEWHSVQIAVVLASLHAPNVALAYLITKAALPADYDHARTLATLGGLLAFLSPVFLNEAGTTFADVSTSALALGAVFCALRSDEESHWWKDRSLTAGLLMGIAAALKLSNLVFGPACALLLLVMQPTVLRRARAITLLGLGSVLGFVLAHGYWGWQLWKAVGNPVFPFFGKYFPTDIFPKEGAMLERFLPNSVLDSLSLPFRMMQPRSWIYIETVSPDLRFAALMAIAAIGACIWCLRRKSAATTEAAWRARRTLALALYFVAAFGLWQWTTGNGRYGLIVSLLCGPVVAVVTYAFFRARAASILIPATLIVLQTIHLQNANLRWSHGPWTRTWYEVSVPDRLRKEPSLYISVGANSNSFIYPYLARDSAFTNPIGQIAFDLAGPGGAQIRALLQKYRGRVRMLATGPSAAEADQAAIAAWTWKMDQLISRLGYGIEANDCDTILAAAPPESGQDFNSTDPVVRGIRTCRLVERPFALAEERAHATRIAREIVSWCPKLFKPAYTVMERRFGGWSASYPATDSMILIAEGMIYGVFTRSAADLSIATVEAWERGDRPACDSFPDTPRETYTFE